jgi:hypothetical protein
MPTSSASSSSSSSSNSLVTYAGDFFGILMLPFTIIWGLISGFINGGSTTNQTSGSNSNRQNSQSRNIPPVNDNIRFHIKLL